MANIAMEGRQSSGGDLNLRVIVEDSPTCRLCRSTDVIAAGRRLYVTLGELLQLYRCRQCGSNFSANRAYKKWYSEDVISFVCDLGARGYRPKDIAVQAKERFPHEEVQESTAYHWLKCYGIQEFSKSNTRVVTPRQLIDAVGGLVPVERLARELGVSPIIAQRALREMSFIGDYPKFATFGWQVRDLKAVEKRLATAAANINDPNRTRAAVEKLIVKSLEMVRITRTDLQGKQEGWGSRSAAWDKMKSGKQAGLVSPTGQRQKARESLQKRRMLVRPND